MSKSSERLLLFIPTLGGGGAAKVIVALANGIKEISDIEVWIAVLTEDGEFRQGIRSDIPVVELNCTRVSRSVRSLARTIKELRPTYVLSTLGYANVAMIAASRYARFSGAVFVREANVLQPGRLHRRGWVGSNLLRAMMKLSYPKADGIIANSLDTLNSLEENGICPHGRGVVISNPVTLPQVIGSGNRQVSPSSDPYICSVGRLTKQKGFDTLIRAFSKISDPNLRLVIAGEGEERRSLERLVYELGILGRVELPGFVKEPARLMERASAFVLASRWEGFGNVVVEALASGCPIVATNCPGGPSEILVNGEYGPMVGVDDVDELAHAMEKVIAHDNEDARVQRQLRACEYDYRRIAAQYLEVIRGR